MKQKIGALVVICFLLSASPPKLGGNLTAHLEVTDLCLPRIDPQVSTQFYHMLKQVDFLLKNKEVTYWLTAGSLLGAVRHQGMIPWDDDIDLAFFEKDIGTIISLRSDIKKMGYEIFVNRDYLKIYLIDGQSISKEEGGVYPWKYPFIDLFPMKQYGDKVIYASERLCNGFANEWFNFTDVSSLVLIAFGSLQVPIPNNASEYLERVYGQDVWDVAYADYNHAEEKRIQKTKVRLITKECAPDLSIAGYTIPWK